MTLSEIQDILKLVEYKEGFSFVVGDDYIQLQELTVCDRTIKPYLSKGRKWKWSQHMTKSEVVTTALKAVLQYEEQEAREKFKYKGLSIFDPNYSVDELWELWELRSIDNFEPLDYRDIRLAEFKFVVSSLLNSLPLSRDWLDPMLEKAMVSLVNE